MRHAQLTLRGANKTRTRAVCARPYPEESVGLCGERWDGRRAGECGAFLKHLHPRALSLELVLQSLQLLPALGFGFQDGVGFQHFLVIVDDEPGPFLLEQVGCDRAEVAGTSSRALGHQPVVSHGNHSLA